MQANQGYFRMANSLGRSGSLLAIAVFCRLAALPGIWQERGALAPYHVRGPIRELAADLRVSVKRVRGALGWLIDRGYLERMPTGNGAVAVYRVVHGARFEDAITVATPTTCATAADSQGHGSPKKGTVKGTVEARSNQLQANGLQPSTPPARARSRAQVLKTLEDEGLNTSPKKTDAVGESPGRAREAGQLSEADCERRRQQQHRWIELQRKTP